MFGIVAPSLRRFGLCIVALIVALGVVTFTRPPVFADEPPTGLTFPAEPTTENTDLTLPVREGGRLPFCGLYKTSRVPRTPQDRQAISATMCTNGSAGGFPCSNVDLQAYILL